ncbi:MAG TPA: exodeoxyribonuclease V subunit alpha, partial [Accumulibacter sp.]|uniref:exodeoxyribonuclease V subunit alpha n=1 Tax=Accumulibacter sp. TaxID=2053492 RepID=UPI002B69CF88
RLSESIAGAVARLPLADLANGAAVRAAIPVAVTTLHRLLGSRPDTRLFRHHAGNPIPVDVLVIDEASMVDLEMMAAVLAALPARARLILLGDKDQLASVEAGAVLGELCRHAGEGRYTPLTRDWLASATGQKIDRGLVDEAGSALDQAVAMLRFSHRFSADSGIGQLAEAVNVGDFAAVEEVWRRPAADLAMLPPRDSAATGFDDLVIDGRLPQVAIPDVGTRVGYRHYLGIVQAQRPQRMAGQPAFDGWARQVLRAHAEFQVLCALRRGPWGVEGLNQRIARALHAAKLIPATDDWYLGRPVLITRNDYALGLMNGDIGITLEIPGGPEAADEVWVSRVAFPAGDGSDGIRWVLPSRLQAVETVYALTVHKSQGSEFTHAALVLPEKPNPILTRELMYTGITRARRWFTLVNPGGADVQRLAVERRVLRVSGLLDAG